MNLQPTSIHTVSWDGKHKFVAENESGCQAIMEKTHSSGSGSTYMNPMDYFISSLGACPGIEITSICREKNIDLQSLQVRIESVRKADLPTIFDSIHVLFSVSGDIDELQIQKIIHEVMTLRCPIAVSFGRLADLTWNLQVIRNS